MAEKLTRVLYVEDEPDIQMVAKLALETVGDYTVQECNSGDEALKQAPAFKPQLILLDVMMPGMDGPTTFQHLRKLSQTAKTPIIFMTAKVQPEEIEQYMKMGAIAVIAKPFDPMRLATEIEENWENYHG